MKPEGILSVDSRRLHHFKKTDPSTNRVRLLGGFCFSAYCPRLTSFSGSRRCRPDHSRFGKSAIPRFSFASKFSALRGAVPATRPDGPAFGCPLRPSMASGSYPHSPYLVRFPAFFPATAARRFDEQGRSNAAKHLCPLGTGRARAAFGKLVDTLHDPVKQVVDVHGRWLLVVNSDCFPAYLPERRRQKRRERF